MSAIACEPLFALAVPLVCSTTTATVALPAGFKRFLVTNDGTVSVFVKSGPPGLTATASYTGHGLLPAGSAQVLTIQHEAIAGITASGAATISIVPCSGGL